MTLNRSRLRNGSELGQIRPRRDFYPEARDMNSMTIPGAYSTLENDVYVLLVSWEQITASSATFKVFINPLINLVWWGGLILIIGTFIAAWPHEKAVVTVRAEKPAVRKAGATA